MSQPVIEFESVVVVRSARGEAATTRSGWTVMLQASEAQVRAEEREQHRGLRSNSAGQDRSTEHQTE